MSLYLTSITSTLVVTGAEHASRDLILVLGGALGLLDDWDVNGTERTRHFNVPQEVARGDWVGTSPAGNFTECAGLGELVETG